jgi:ABC-type uncharacterized transport system substrate-binding protein
MKRREFIVGVGAAAWPVVTRAQQQAMPVIGFLHSEDLRDVHEALPAFLRGLGEIGFIDGRNVTIDYRWGQGRQDRLPGLALQLIKRQVNVIIENSSVAILTTKAATQTIPIIFVTGVDPVQAGFVVSLNRPSGNVTGVSLLNSTLTAKRFELLHELVPTASTVAFMVNSDLALSTEMQTSEAQLAARTLGLNMLVLNASSPTEIDAAFTTMVERGVGALILNDATIFRVRGDQVAELATRYRLPIIYAYRENTAAGGLMSYSTDLKAAWRQVGAYAGRILNGEKPANLPVQLATKITLVINLKTAKALGLTVPQSILLRADEVIE